METDTVKNCACCGVSEEDCDLTEIPGEGWLCPECMESKDWRVCEYCGNAFHGGLTDLGDMTAICPECLNDQYMTCDCCGESNDPEMVRYIELPDGSCICESCFAEHSEAYYNSILEAVRKAMQDGDDDTLEEYLSVYDELYEEELERDVLRIAVELHNYDYVEANADDEILNDKEDGTSSYLDETDDLEMRRLLIACGAKDADED